MKTILLFLLLTISTFSQNKVIEGQILNEKLNPIQNAFIESEDGIYFVNTDKNGFFTISLPADCNNIKVQYTGLKTEIFDINNKCYVTLILLNHFWIEFKTVNDEEKFYSKRRNKINKKFKKTLKNNQFKEDVFCN